MTVRRLSVLFKSSPEDMIIDLREREKDVERSINRFPPLRSPTRDQTHNPLVYKTRFRPAEPPGLEDE